MRSVKFSEIYKSKFPVKNPGWVSKSSWYFLASNLSVTRLIRFWWSEKVGKSTAKMGTVSISKQLGKVSNLTLTVKFCEVISDSSISTTGVSKVSELSPRMHSLGSEVTMTVNGFD